MYSRQASSSHHTHSARGKKKICVQKDDEIPITHTYLSIMATFPTGKGDLRLLKIWRFIGTAGKMLRLFLGLVGSKQMNKDVSHKTLNSSF